MFRRVSTRPIAQRAFTAGAFRTFATAAKQKQSSWNWSRTAFFTGSGIAASAVITSSVVFCATQAKGDQPPFNYKAVRKDIEALLDDDITQGPILVRLAWHEAGSWDAKAKDGAPNSGSMRFEPECKYGGNAGLQIARTLLEPIKKKHPNITYGDLWSLAGCIAIEAMAGPEIKWRWGRHEAKSGKECGPDGRLPDASKGQGHVRDVFYRMGFNDREIVALLGAHAIGECHPDRSGYSGPWTNDKYGFSNAFFTELVGNDWIVNKDKPNLQFKDSTSGQLMMLPSDIALILDPKFKKIVNEYAKNQDVFFKDFAKAFQKLVELGQLDLKDV